MEKGFEGGCYCGAVRYKSEADSLAEFCCHCRDCQRKHGSAFATGIATLKDKMEISGEIHKYHMVADSGNNKYHLSCAVCGFPIGEEITEMENVLMISAGSLDDPSLFKPQAHFWISSKQPWLVLDGSIPEYEKQSE